MCFIFHSMLYPLYALVSLSGTLLAMGLLNWWAPLFANDQGNLPKALRWLQTFDASLDAGWQDGYLPVSWGHTRFKRYWARVYWLYRNPVYGLDYGLLGLPFDPQKWRVVRHLQTPTCVLFMALGPAFNLYYHGRWGLLKLGWKAWNYWDGHRWKTSPWGKKWRVPVCCSFNPFQRRNAPSERKLFS
jgi:hypothetical protein